MPSTWRSTSSSSRELSRSIELYGGPFLAGFFLPDAGEFERWVESERARLTRRYVEALSRLGGDAEAAGVWARAAETWRRAVDAEPFSARLVVRLMRALAAADDRSAAVQTARTYADLTRRELDIDPDPAVLATEAELRNGNAAAGRAAAGAASVVPP